jgi:regulator of sirC expression with transglutaminase-like and TPR domain
VDPVGELRSLASPDPRLRLAAEERLAQAGPAGIEALARLLACHGVPDVLRTRATELHGTLVRAASYDAFVKAIPEPSKPDLWAGAVALGAEGHPRLDVGSIEKRLESLVEGARAVVGGAGGDAVPARVERLNRFLFEEQGYHGDSETYEDVRNSYVSDVLERRQGIPVTLGVLWMTVAGRLGLAVNGVGLPMHFVARCEAEDGPLYVDAFHGKVLDREGCVRLVADAAGRYVSLPDTTFRPLRSAEVLLRMLRNVRHQHEKAGRLEGVLSAIDRALHLTPLDAGGWRDRAVVLSRLSRPAAAARSLSRALALDPQAPDRAVLETLRRRLQGEAAARN